MGAFPKLIGNLTNLYSLELSSIIITLDSRTNITFPILTILDISSCKQKNFPYFLKNVKTLSCLDTYNNKIHGQITKWFSSMRWDALKFLNLSHNSRTVHLEKLKYYNLNYLDLKFIFHLVPLPSSFCYMNKLKFLDLSRNFINSIQSWMGSMMNIMVFEWRRNNFTVSIPLLCAKSTSLSLMVTNVYDLCRCRWSTVIV